MKKRTLFVSAFVLSLTTFLGWMSLSHYAKAELPAPQEISPGVFVTGQVSVEAIPALNQQGFKSVIALRPDNEAPDQPSSTQIGAANAQHGIKFAYIPVPSGGVPAQAIQSLETALKNSPRPVLLYCRSGRRAANAFSLEEASRPDGPDALTLVQRARQAGHPIDAILPDIEARIAQRAAHSPN